MPPHFGGDCIMRPFTCDYLVFSYALCAWLMYSMPSSATARLRMHSGRTASYLAVSEHQVSLFTWLDHFGFTSRRTCHAVFFCWFTTCGAWLRHSFVHSLQPIRFTNPSNHSLSFVPTTAFMAGLGLGPQHLNYSVFVFSSFRYFFSVRGLD